MKELSVRAASGAVFAAVLLLCAWWGSISTAALFSAVAVFAALEWHRLHHASSGRTPLLSVLVVLGAYAAGVAPALGSGLAASASAVVGLLLLACWAALRSGQPDPGRQFLTQVGGAVLVGLPLSFATHLVAHDPLLLIGFLLLLWTNDSGAYLVGKAIGRHKLLPAVSPGKTWEGLVGGIALALGAAYGLAIAWPQVLPASEWMMMALVTSLSATLGDLFESAIKRAAGVKDSGRLMPGHGGALDRFDGFLFAAPAAYLLLEALAA